MKRPLQFYIANHRTEGQISKKKVEKQKYCIRTLDM